MFKHRKKIIAAIVAAMVLVLIPYGLFQTQQTNAITKEPTPTAQFVISSWDFPDSYSQGLYGILLESNTSGSWQVVLGTKYYNQTASYNATDDIGFAIRVKVFFHFNYTLANLSDPTDQALAQNHIRTNMTVERNTYKIFSLVNGTYNGVTKIADFDLWLVVYYFLFDVLIKYDSIYTVSFDYDFYYSETFT